MTTWNPFEPPLGLPFGPSFAADYERLDDLLDEAQGLADFLSTGPADDDAPVPYQLTDDARRLLGG